MLKNHVYRFNIALYLVVSTFLCFSALSNRLVSASGGSIAMANYYPNDGETYGFIDHFVMQTTEVNTNTTVSVSIDGGSLIPMTYQGIINETAPGDTAARDWYTWQIAIPTLTTLGAHKFQFYYHYYVWQNKNQYYAEFNACSTIKSFTIAPSPQSTPNTPNPQTPHSSQASALKLQSNLFPPRETPTTTAAKAVIISIFAVAFALRKHARLTKT